MLRRQIFRTEKNKRPISRLDLWASFFLVPSLEMKTLNSSMYFAWPVSSLAHWFCRRRFLNVYFRYIAIISSWRRACLFIWTNLNSIYQRLACAKFGSIFGVLVLEEKISKFGQWIFTILLISHLRKVCYPYDIPALTWSSGRSVLAVSSEVPLQCSHL